MRKIWNLITFDNFLHVTSCAYPIAIVVFAYGLFNGLEAKNNQLNEAQQRLITIEKEVTFIRMKLEEKK